MDVSIKLVFLILSKEYCLLCFLVRDKEIIKGVLIKSFLESFDNFLVNVKDVDKIYIMVVFYDLK